MDPPDHTLLNEAILNNIDDKIILVTTGLLRKDDPVCFQKHHEGVPGGAFVSLEEPVRLRYSVKQRGGFLGDGRVKILTEHRLESCADGALQVSSFESLNIDESQNWIHNGGHAHRTDTHLG